MTDRVQRTRRLFLVAAVFGLAAAALGVVHGLFEHNDALIALYAVLGVAWAVTATLVGMRRWPPAQRTA